MSQTILQFIFRVGGTLTDPDSSTVVFSDPTATLAVNRTDTNAAVTPPTVGTAMTRISTGVYQYAITDPAFNLTYQWWAKYYYDGAPNFVQFTTPGTAAAIVPSLPPDVLKLTLARIREEVETILGGSQISVELTQQDYTKAIMDATRVYNRNVPRWNFATLPVTAAQKKYLITQPGLLGVVAVDFVGNGIQFGASTEFGPPFSNVSPTGLGIAGSTFGEVDNALHYAKRSAQVASAEPEWVGQWEGNGNGTASYYLYVSVPSIGTAYCSYTFSWAVTPDDDPVTGLWNIPDADTDWFMNYTACRCKIILARVLGKYKGLPSSTEGAEEIDWEELREDAKEEMIALTEQIQSRRRPLVPQIG